MLKMPIIQILVIYTSCTLGGKIVMFDLTHTIYFWAYLATMCDAIINLILVIDDRFNILLKYLNGNSRSVNGVNDIYFVLSGVLIGYSFWTVKTFIIGEIRILENIYSFIKFDERWVVGKCLGFFEEKLFVIVDWLRNSYNA